MERCLYRNLSTGRESEFSWGRQIFFGREVNSEGEKFAAKDGNSLFHSPNFKSSVPDSEY